MGSSRILVFSTVGLAALGLLLVCTGLIGRPSPDLTQLDPPKVQSLGSTADPALEPQGHRTAKPADHTALRDEVAGPVLPESDPVVVSIPRLGVRSGLVRLGLDSRREMEVPRDPAMAGWFSRGAAPGALGPAVIAGHVTWNGTPGVFYRLGTLRGGDRVAVTRMDGATAVFVVGRVARYSKARFPSRAVYGAIDHAGLRLITCGGAYDASRHRYEDNIVVFARLEEVRAPHR